MTTPSGQESRYTSSVEDCDVKDRAKLAVGPATPGSLDAALAATGIPVVAIDLRSAPSSGAVADWLNTPQLMPSIGAVYSENSPGTYFASANLHSFDLIFFVNHTTAAHEIPKHPEIDFRGRTAAFSLSAISPNLPALPSVLLLSLLLSVDLALSGTRLNTGDSFKWKAAAHNKRHTNVHRPLTSHSPIGVQIPPSPPSLSREQNRQCEAGQAELTRGQKNGANQARTSASSKNSQARPAGV
jgi:hypothetical protein